MDWLYDNAEHVYREDTDDDDALIIGLLLLLALRDNLSVLLEAEAADLAQALASGDLTIQQWVLAMRELLERSYVEQYALGKGGTHNLFAGDMAALATLLAGQYAYLQAFAQQVAAGELSAEQAAARAALYMSSTTQAFEQGRAAGYGGLVLPAYPGDGSTVCGVRCKCHWLIEEYADRWECYWRLGVADHCVDCIENSLRWNPLVVTKTALRSRGELDQHLDGLAPGRVKVTGAGGLSPVYLGAHSAAEREESARRILPQSTGGGVNGRH